MLSTNPSLSLSGWYLYATHVLLQRYVSISLLRWRCWLGVSPQPLGDH